jgi:TonB-linked SusC/RagA family outer membrane protein
MRKFALFLLVFALIGVQVVNAQARRLTGTVTSALDGSTIPGVSVVVKGTSIGTITNINGVYTLDVPQDATTIVFSFVGMRTTEAAITGTTVNVTLESDVIGVDEVVVIGYGTARAVGTVVGSLTRVSSEKLQERPTANVWDAMQGKVAGLQVYNSSGEPTALSSVRLHGVGSLGASSTPLYVLDGIPVNPGNVLSLNPNDFESVTVLKDASATSIYGSRAANGVIYITTKSGKADSKANITINAQYGTSSLANEDFFNKFMNSKQLTDFWLDTRYRTQAQVDDLLSRFPHDTKWYKYYYKDAAPTYQGDISVSGGSERTKYFVSGSYFNQEGLATRSNYERYSMRVNLNSQANDWLGFGVNLSGSTDARQSNPFGTNNTNRGLAMLAQPFYTPYDENGKPFRGLIPGWGRYDPYYLEEMQKSDGNNMQFNMMSYVQINPFKGFTIRSQAGIDGYDYRESNKQLPSFVGSLNNGNASEYFSRDVTRTITNTAEYKFSINNTHNVTALVGQEGVDNAGENFTASSTGHTDDRLMLLPAGPNNRNVGHNRSEYAFLSYFGRLDYGFAQKYFVDFLVRQDQSSRFGFENRAANFWAAGAMWNIKKEAFMQGIGAISSMTIKASIGTSGNSEIGNYQHLAQVGTTQYDGKTGWVISTPGNPRLSWENQQKLTVGTKVGLLSDKIRLNLEYYNRVTESMLISVPQPYTTGFANITENVGSLKNSGIDVELDFDVVRNRNFYFTPYVNYNYNKNEVTELFQGKEYWIIPNTGVAWAIGEPVSFFYPLYAGVDPADGQPMWYVPGADITKTTKGETTKVFNTAALNQNIGIPRYAPMAGGFGLNTGWKGLTLQADFAFVLDKYLFNNDRYFFENPNVFGGFNQSVTVLDYWKQPGDVTAFPRWASQFTQFDSRLIENASFMRLKNLTIGYSLPESLVRKTGLLTSTRLYVTGRNLLTWSNYSGPDPEVDSNISLGANPNTKQLTFGISLSF